MNTIKKILSVVCSIAMVFAMLVMPANAADSIATFTGGTVTTELGDGTAVVSVPITVTGAATLTLLTVKVEVEGATITGYTAGNAISGVTAPATGNSSVTMPMTNLDGVALSEGTYATLEVTVPNTEAKDFDVVLTVMEAMDATYTDVKSQLTAVNGKISVEAPAAEAIATFTAGTVTTELGDDTAVVSVPITVTGAATLTLLTVKVEVEGATITGYTAGNAISGVTAPATGNSSVTMPMTNLDGVALSEGTYATLEVTVPNTEVKDFDVVLTVMEAMDATYTDVKSQLATVAGTISVVEGEPEPVNVLESITVEPSTLTVAYDAEVDKEFLVEEGVEVTAHYSVEDDAVVEDWTYEDGVISYTEDDITVTAEIEIIREEEPVNVLEAITVEPATLTVEADAEVDKAYLVDAGVVVTAQYSIADDAVVEDWTYEDGVISYTEDDVTVTAEITILREGEPVPVNVLEAITVEPATLTVAHDAEVDKAYLVEAGVVVTAQYSIADDAVVEDWTYEDGVISYTEDEVTVTAEIEIVREAAPVVPSDLKIATTVTVSGDVAAIKATATVKNDGGAAIEKVTLTIAPFEGEVAETVEIEEADEKGRYIYTFEGLTKGEKYTITAVATNEAGDSEAKTKDVTAKKASSGGGGGGSISKLPTLNSGASGETEAPVVDPEAPVVDPEAPVVDPEAPVVDPEAPVVDPEAPAFTDVAEGDWFSGSVDYVVESGLMNGVGSGNFAPNATLTRAMLVTVLYRAEGSPMMSGKMPFADVDAEAYYADAVLWAYQNDIVKGVSADAFAPDANITREQAAAIIYRHAIYKGLAVAVLSENLGFADADAISEYAIFALNWAVEQNLITGYDDNTVRPANSITRAEMATILQRYLNK